MHIYSEVSCIQQSTYGPILHGLGWHVDVFTTMQHSSTVIKWPMLGVRIHWLANCPTYKDSCDSRGGRTKPVGIGREVDQGRYLPPSTPDPVLDS